MRKLFAIVALLATLLPGTLHAKTFYITQGMGFESWAVAISTRQDTVTLDYQTYGDWVLKNGREPFYAYDRQISVLPAA